MTLPGEGDPGQGPLKRLLGRGGGLARRLRFPHPIALLVGCVLLAAALSWVLPAGAYQRREDRATGRTVVVAGTYHAVEPAPVGPFRAVVAIPRGLEDAADVVFLIFLVGGAFTVVDETGALRSGVRWLVGRLGGRDVLLIPVVALFFAAGGALENMQEEIIALVPVLLVLTSRAGFEPVVAVAMSGGAAMVASAFSPINPFQVGIAQKVAQLPLLSGWGYRTALLALALAFWVGGTMRYALRTRGPRRDGPEAAEAEREVRASGRGPAGGDARVPRRDLLVLALVLATFAMLVVGILRWGWGFDQLSAAFFIMGVAAGLVGRLGVEGTAVAYVKGFRDMAYAALLVGFARAIFVVLEDGRIVDTIVHGLFSPIHGLPPTLSALGMMAAHVAVHVPVPSVSGHAVLTMPILVPLSDLLGLARQAAVLAYQMGAGLTDLITPTNGALLALLAAGGVSYRDWFRFAAPRY
ncbi:MAG TPA: Na+/H+ antiporter NhaC family protein, partial [Gemmatimonadota bacterium]|nr:Na+/H+ antiporter NhaC family protein [Gemmatimonadota bacterium]